MKFRFLATLLLIVSLSCVQQNSKTLSILHYAPDQAAVLIKINDLEAFKNTVTDNSFLAALKPSNVYNHVLQSVSYLQYIQPHSESLLAFSEVNNQKFEFVFITNYSDRLFQLDSLKNKTVETLEFANATFDAYQIDDHTFYTHLVNDKLIISSSKLLLEKYDGKRLTDPSEVLEKLYNNSNSLKPATIFWHPKYFNKFIASTLSEKSSINISSFSDWVSADLNADNNKLHLTGVSIANDSTWNYIDLFANTKPMANNTIRFAPSSAEAILSYTFDDYQVFAENQQLSTGITKPLNPDLDAIEEIGIIYTNDQQAILLNTYGSAVISDYLISQKKSGIEFQGKEIILLKNTNFLSERLHPLVYDFKSNYVAILEDAFIFTQDLDFLKVILTNFRDGKTFDKGILYQSLYETIAKESSMLFMTNGENLNSFASQNFAASVSRDLKKTSLTDFGFVMQSITDKNLYHTNVVVQQLNQPLKKRTISSRFNIVLENEIATTPQFVKNHLNGKQEVLVQDEKNVLYLISDIGKILWKKQLQSLIQGRVHQVDIFKNGRLQMAFTTNNELMVLDRNGTEVRQFTKIFKGGNLNPLAVFDYENKKNYRFVVTQNEKTFMYDNKASIVKGFKYTKAEQPIIDAPKHLVIGNKDYLVFKLKDGSLKLLNRVGDVRTKVSEKIDFSNNEVFVYNNRFTLTDKKGMLFQINDRGKISKTPLNFSSDHGLFATGRSLVTMNENILNIKGKPIELEMGVYTPPHIFYINNKIYVAVTDLQNEKLYLYDSQGEKIPGFPIHGVSQIDLNDVNKDKNINIVVQENEYSLIVYRI